MALEICPECKKMHYRTSPCITETKSTERKNKLVANGVVPAARVEPTDSAVSAKQTVDTKPRRGRPKMDAPTSARVDYQREYVAKWRRGEVGNKYRSKAKEDKQNG